MIIMTEEEVYFYSYLICRGRLNNKKRKSLIIFDEDEKKRNELCSFLKDKVTRYKDGRLYVKKEVREQLFKYGYQDDRADKTIILSEHYKMQIRGMLDGLPNKNIFTIREGAFALTITSNIHIVSLFHDIIYQYLSINSEIYKTRKGRDYSYSIRYNHNDSIKILLWTYENRFKPRKNIFDYLYLNNLNFKNIRYIINYKDEKKGDSANVCYLLYF